jgi:hypothetical protein
MVEAQHRIAGFGQTAREEHELAVAADPVLRAADDDDDAALGFCGRAVENADKLGVAAAKN